MRRQRTAPHSAAPARRRKLQYNEEVTNWELVRLYNVVYNDQLDEEGNFIGEGHKT